MSTETIRFVRRIVSISLCAALLTSFSLILAPGVGAASDTNKTETATKDSVNIISAEDKLLAQRANIIDAARKEAAEVVSEQLAIQEAAAKEAGADYVGLDEYIDKIKGGWTDIDVIITMPSIMGKIGALGRVLGPRGLMPNPKSGTVTMNVAQAVKEVKQGKIDFKVDKTGIVHTSIGKVSFSADAIRENAKEFIDTIIKLKPTAAKGTYIKSLYLSSTMSKGIKIDTKSFDE